ncbi:YopX family protein [Clostridium sp. Mt-5]|uniref:YopX family protein n=1 Tax=Clostridium moutaii TaxID=3240932 RepID=A0ABV4BMX1_9CLOT
MSRKIKFRAWHKNNKHMCENVKTDLLDRNYLEFMQYTELNDVNGNNIYEGDIVSQKSVINSCQNIDFTGEVKFYNGSWQIDSGNTTIYLFNENCENKVIGNKFEGFRK